MDEFEPDKRRLENSESVRYSRQNYTFEATGEFESWFEKLRDKETKLRILNRMRRLVAGNSQDIKCLGSGVFELRMHFGPGYRIYFTFDPERLHLILLGGDKSTQRTDIAKVKNLATAWQQVWKATEHE